jgi:hypothetical protein
MAKKNKIGDIELDDFHYHEVVHTIHILMGLIDDTLIQHPVLKAEKEARKEIEKATDHLFDAYQKLVVKY